MAIDAIRLRQLRDFLEIVEAGSLRAAARRRGISQPVLTKSLRSLEAAVSARLVHRTVQGILLTASGRALLARAKAVQTQLEKAREDLAEIAGHRGSTVTFGASASGLVLVPEAITRFETEFPRFYVRTVEGPPRALLPLLRDGSLDFFLGPRRTEVKDPQVRTRPLFRLPLAVAGRRGHSRRGVRSLAQLADMRWLLLSAGGWSDSLAGDAFRSAGLQPPPSILQCESYATAVALLSQTETLGLLPRQHLLDPSLRGLVEELPVEDRLPELTFAVYLRSDEPLTSAAAGLMRAITVAARTMMADARPRPG